MSVRVMAMVWNYYPSGGNEMLLALALADFANDEGERIYPSVATLSHKTRQAERTTQNMLKKMQMDEWLEVVKGATGGRNVCREFRISSKWIENCRSQNDALKGAKNAPFSQDGVQHAIEKGANPAPFNPERVQPTAEKGANPAPFNPERVQPTTEKGANPAPFNPERVQPTAEKGANPAPFNPERVQPTAERVQVTTLKGAKFAPKPLVNHQLTVSSFNKMSANTNRTPFPDNFLTNEQHDELAKKHNLNIQNEVTHFKAHHLANASLYADWHQAFTVWLMKSNQFGKSKGIGAPVPPTLTIEERLKNSYQHLANTFGKDIDREFEVFKTKFSLTNVPEYELQNRFQEQIMRV